MRACDLVLCSGHVGWREMTIRLKGLIFDLRIGKDLGNYTFIIICY